MRTSPNFMLVLFALACGVAVALYLGAKLYVVACEVCGMCDAYESRESGR